MSIFNAAGEEEDSLWRAYHGNKKINKSDEKPLEKAVPHHDDDDLFQYFNWLWTSSWKDCM